MKLVSFFSLLILFNTHAQERPNILWISCEDINVDTNIIIWKLPVYS